MKRPSGAVLVSLVLSTVLIQLLVAVLLKELAGHNIAPVLAMSVLGLALALNGVRFAIWGYTHKHYPLSRSYPLTALFFPCILAVSIWYGEPISWLQYVATGLIVIGVSLMSWNAHEHP